MYEIIGKKIEDKKFLGDLKPVEVLYELDAPRIFTSLDKDSKPILLVQSDESATLQRFLVINLSDKILNGLKSGAITLHEGLEQPRLWIVDVDYENNIEGVWLSDLCNIPADRRPNESAMLWPTLQPELTIRIHHDEAKLGSVRTNLIQNTVERAKKSLRIVADHVATIIPEGADLLKEIINPPAQRFAYNSFEASFKMPQPKNDAQRDFIDKFNACFASGFKDIQLIDDDDPESINNLGNTLSPHDRLSTLAALKELAPSAHHPIKQIEVSGTLVNMKIPVVFTQKSYKMLREYIVKSEGEDIMIQATGKILECDRGKYLFELREIQSSDLDSDSIKCQYESNIEDEILSAFNESYDVKVSGVKKNNASVLMVDRIVRIQND